MLEWRRKRVGLGREGKREMGEGILEEEKWGKVSTYLHGRDVTEILTNYCVFAYK